MNADIKQCLNEVDFSLFDVCKDQDPNENISVRIIFDWSTFYCGALQTLTDVVNKIGRRCQILVPLDPHENIVPLDVVRHLANGPYTLTVAEGQHPLFDWSLDGNPILGTNYMNGQPKRISDIVNPKRYLRIYAFDR
jgi:hypothetical protein